LVAFVRSLPPDRAGAPDGREAERIALRERERELWTALSQAWVNGCRPLAALHLGDALTNLSLSGVVRRGFVSHVTCTAAQWTADRERRADVGECPACEGKGGWDRIGGGGEPGLYANSGDPCPPARAPADSRGATGSRRAACWRARSRG
jgi:hypothetical protein